MSKRNLPWRIDVRLALRYALYLAIAAAGTYVMKGSNPATVHVLAYVVVFLLVVSEPAVPLGFNAFMVAMAHVMMQGAAMLFDPVTAAWVGAVGSASREEISGQVRPVAVAYNRLQLGLATLASAWTFRSLMGESLRDPRSVLALLCSNAALIGVNFLTISIWSVIFNKESLRQFSKNFKSYIPANYIVTGLMAYVMVGSYLSTGLIGLILFALPIMTVQTVVHRYLDIRAQFLATIRALMAALEARDPLTFGHSDRVSRLAVEVAKELGMSYGEIEAVQVAAILHDIGKIGIADAVLRKTGRYTEAEFVEMARHPVIGERIAANAIPAVEVARAIRHHHERYDGRGYPDGLRGDEIPLGARIITVCDAFDAMTSLRPYRRRLTVEQAVAELKRHAGTQFDPRVVEAFLRVVRDAPRFERAIRPEVALEREDVLAQLEPAQRRAAVIAYAAQRRRRPRRAQDEVAAAADGPPARAEPAESKQGFGAGGG